MIKITEISDYLFKIGEFTYIRGDYYVEYSNLSSINDGINLKNKYTQDTIFDRFMAYSEFVDFKDDPFISIEQLSSYINGVIFKSYGGGTIPDNLATTGSNNFTGNQIITGSLIVTNGITGSLYGTSSYSNISLSSSFSISSSNADLLDGQHGLYYLDRINHTGTQSIATISGLQTNLNNLSSSIGNATSSINIINAGLLLKQDKTIFATGSLIDFVSPKIYNTPTSPTTSSITNNLTGSILGIVQKIYHNNGTIPTFPSGWVLLGSTTYATGELNIIYAEWSTGSRVEYWITQEN